MRTFGRRGSCPPAFGQTPQLAKPCDLLAAADYCKNLPDGASTDRCWQAYNIFENKKREAEGSCSLEESSGIAGGSGAHAPCVLALLVLKGRILQSCNHSKLCSILPTRRGGAE